MIRKMVVGCLFLFLCLVFGWHRFTPQKAMAQVNPTVTPIPVSDWPQLQRDPQHTGRSSYSFASNPTTQVWAFNFAGSNIARGARPEKTYPQVQPVVVGGRLFIGTTNGTFYCFNASNGNILWTYNDSGNLGGIMGTAGVEGDKV